MRKQLVTDLPLQAVEVSFSPAAGLPLVITLHGRGADMHDLADLAPMIDPEGRCRFLFPNAPRKFEAAPGYSFGQSWFDGWPPAGTSLQESRGILSNFIDEAQKKYAVTDATTVLAGFSQGGLMSFDSGYRRKAPLAGIIVLSGALYEEDAPDFSARKDQKILIVHGTDDDVIPVMAARRAQSVLKAAGVNAEYHEFPMGHHTSAESVDVVKDFIARAFK